MISVIRRNRRLPPDGDVFSQNAWDDTEWTQEMLDDAEARIAQQREESSNHCALIEELELKVASKWDEFYSTHGDKFFKDRKWIFSEFPEIMNRLQSGSPPCNIFEAGCGVGNAVANIIAANQNPLLHVFCCDVSSNAIDTLKAREFYVQNSDKVTAFQADICHGFEEILCKEVAKESMDFVTTIFTLSALKPELLKKTVTNLTAFLKPGGTFLFRDYAKYDLTQLRFKSKSFLSDNYYMRSDGTTSYFFTEEIVDELFTAAGLEKVQLVRDNRMLVNRQKSLRMCRCWVQAKYKKVV